MPIPDFQSCMLPMLLFASDGKEHRLLEAKAYLAKHFELTAEELDEWLPSRRARRFYNRVAWAKVYLERAGILRSAKRGIFVITDRGRELLAAKPLRIDIALLDRYPEFREFRAATPKEDAAPAVESTHVNNLTPEEQLEAAYQTIRAEVMADLLVRVKAASPAFFEQLVVDLLLRMGYGGNQEKAGQAIGGTGDEGIDGIINEDRLGLDTIYIQAKRWDGTVGRPEIQKFVGALHGKRARKGVFITTGTFSTDARQYVANIDPRVVLIDGKALAEYLIDFDIGVSRSTPYILKRVDSDYFAEE
jgi:restriction system protein